jgi:type IV pilus assembly protein PilX
MREHAMTNSCPQASRGSARERGVVLIVALVMLVVISLLAAFSMRNALSGEGVSGNVRTTQLASQAAEVALRYCENAIIANVNSGTALPAGFVVQGNQVPPLGVSTSNWDGTRTGVFVLGTSTVNLATATFKRVPECIAEKMPVVTAAGTLTFTSTYIITARGFGPEVAAGTGQPDGSEVWLQSTLEVQ